MADLIEYMVQRGGVWFMTLDELASHARRCLAAGSWNARVVKLPYYERPISGVLAGKSVMAG